MGVIFFGFFFRLLSGRLLFWCRGRWRLRLALLILRFVRLLLTNRLFLLWSRMRFRLGVLLVKLIRFGALFFLVLDCVVFLYHLLFLFLWHRRGRTRLLKSL